MEREYLLYDNGSTHALRDVLITSDSYTRTKVDALLRLFQEPWFRLDQLPPSYYRIFHLSTPSSVDYQN